MWLKEVISEECWAGLACHFPGASVPSRGLTSPGTPLSSAFQVQFGHAGACANQASETAVAKNQALKEAGVFVPRSFDELGDLIQ